MLQPLSDRPQRLQKGAAFVSLAIALAGLLSAIAGYWETHEAAATRIFDSAQALPPREVVIIPGALVFRSGALSDTLADRVACGVDAYRAGAATRVLASGDHGSKGYDEVSGMGSALLAQGVPARDLFLDHAGFRTLDTMERASKVFGVRSAIVCTQRFHLPRALYLAQRFGIDAVGLIADRRHYAAAQYNQVRETVARAIAVLDLTLGRGARLLGPPVDLTGDGRRTHAPSL